MLQISFYYLVMDRLLRYLKQNHFKFLCSATLILNLFAQLPSQAQEKNLTDTMQQVQIESSLAQVKEARIAAKLILQSAEQYSASQECELSCPVGCCKSAEALMYQATISGVMAQMAGSQIPQLKNTVKAACQAEMSVSTEQADCQHPTTTAEFSWPSKDWFDSKGDCKSTAPSTCRFIMAQPNGKILSHSSVNCPDKSDCSKNYFTAVIPMDGKVKLTYKSKSNIFSKEDFEDANRLAKLGISSAMASALSKKYSDDIKLYQKAKQTGGIFSKSKGKKNPNMKTLNKVAGETSKANNSEIAPTAAVTPDEKIDRKQFLKDYHGDLINDSTVNIFEVIKSRYQLQMASFIN